jgi:hypothetical protein
MGTLARTVWTDDDGSGTTGSIVNNAELQAIYDAVEGDLKSANFAAVTTKSVQDNMLAGEIHFFGGDQGEAVADAAYPAGDVIAVHPGTNEWRVDKAHLTGTYKLEAMVKADASGGIVTVELYNLTDAAGIASSEAAGTGSTTGERAISGAITFPAAGTTKRYGIKVKVSAGMGFCWGVRLVRTA